MFTQAAVFLVAAITMDTFSRDISSKITHLQL